MPRTHLLLPVALVALAAAYVARVYAEPGPRRLAVPRRYAALVHATSVVVLITVVIGILLTGSGPHAGDDAAAAEFVSIGEAMARLSWDKTRLALTRALEIRRSAANSL